MLLAKTFGAIPHGSAFTRWWSAVSKLDAKGVQWKNNARLSSSLFGFCAEGAGGEGRGSSSSGSAASFAGNEVTLVVVLRTGNITEAVLEFGTGDAHCRGWFCFFADVRSFGPLCCRQPDFSLESSTKKPRILARPIGLRVYKL